MIHFEDLRTQEKDLYGHLIMHAFLNDDTIYSWEADSIMRAIHPELAGFDTAKGWDKACNSYARFTIQALRGDDYLVSAGKNSRGYTRYVLTPKWRNFFGNLACYTEHKR